MATMQKYGAAALMGMAGLVLSPMAHANTTSSSFQVEATVEPSCAVVTQSEANQIGLTPIRRSDSGWELGDGFAGRATFEVACTNTTPYKIGVRAFETDSPDTATKGVGRASPSGAVAGNTDYLVFSLLKPNGDIWGSEDEADLVSATGAGGAQTYNMDILFEDYNVIPDTYIGTVAVEVEY